MDQKFQLKILVNYLLVKKSVGHSLFLMELKTKLIVFYKQLIVKNKMSMLKLIKKEIFSSHNHHLNNSQHPSNQVASHLKNLSFQSNLFNQLKT